MRRRFRLKSSGRHANKNNDRNQASAGRVLVETAHSASATASIDCGGVLPSDTTRKQTVVSQAKPVVLFAFVLSLAVFVGTRFADSLQGADFPDFYCAARMLAEGHGHQLYDAEAQRQYQARYAARVGTLYIHPPFEAVLYLAVAWLPLRRAYLLWCVLNLAFLAIGLRHCAREALQPWDWSVLLAASLTFVPLLLCLQQGQDSLLLLLLVILAFTALRHERGLAAGCWLALGLFKFQIVLPLVLVLLVTQNRKVRTGLGKGFGLVGLALAGLSAAICGRSVFTAYPGFLLHLRAQPFAGIVPQAMANLRGLTYFFFRSDQSLWAGEALAILSAAALFITLASWRHARTEAPALPGAKAGERFDLAFANTVLFALLVAYHLNPHDLTLLLLPLAVLLRGAFGQTPRLARTQDWVTSGLVGLLFLPPLHLWALRSGVYSLVSLPVLGLLTSSSIKWRRPRSAGIH
jgi:hypothetical protein